MTLKTDAKESKYYLEYELDSLFKLKERLRNSVLDEEYIASLHSKLSKCLDALDKDNPPDPLCPESSSAEAALAEVYSGIFYLADKKHLNIVEPEIKKITDITYKTYDTDGGYISYIHYLLSGAYGALGNYTKFSLEAALYSAYKHISHFCEIKGWDLEKALSAKKKHEKEGVL